MNNLIFQDVLKVAMAEALITIYSIFNYSINSIDGWAEKTIKESLLDSSVEDTTQLLVIEGPLTCPVDEYTENEYFKQLSNPYPKS